MRCFWPPLGREGWRPFGRLPLDREAFREGFELRAGLEALRCGARPDFRPDLPPDLPPDFAPDFPRADLPPPDDRGLDALEPVLRFGPWATLGASG